MCKASCLFCKTKEIKPDPIFCLFWTFLKPWWFRDSVYEKKLEKSEKKLFTFFGIVFVDVQLSSSLLWVRFSSHWMIWNNYIQMTDHRLNFSSVMTKNIYVYIYIFQKKSDDQSILYTLAYRPYCSVQYRDTNFNSIYIKYVINQLHNFDKTCGTKYIIKWITFFFNFSLLLNYKKETFTSPQGFFFFNLWPHSIYIFSLRCNFLIAVKFSWFLDKNQNYYIVIQIVTLFAFKVHSTWATRNKNETFNCSFLICHSLISSFAPNFSKKMQFSI